MQAQIEELVKQTLKADTSLTPKDRAEILAAIRNHGKKETPTPAEPPRLLRRAAVADRLNVTPRTVDAWACRGLLRKVHLPGMARAKGFLAADVDKLICGAKG